MPPRWESRNLQSFLSQLMNQFQERVIEAPERHSCTTGKGVVTCIKAGRRKHLCHLLTIIPLPNRTPCDGGWNLQLQASSRDEEEWD